MTDFINNHKDVITIVLHALTAFGTICAVITALLLAKSERSVKLRVRIAVIPDDLENFSKSLETGDAALRVIVLNTGIQTANIRYPIIRWSIPFYEGMYLSTNENELESFQITAKNGDGFDILKLSEFRKDIKSCAKNLKYFKSIRIRYLKAHLITEEEVWYKATLAPIFKKELRVIAAQIK